MNDQPDRPHTIKRNELTRLPRRWIVLDTEAIRVKSGKGEVQTFRCGHASFDFESKKGRGWAPTEYADFESPRELWEWVDSKTVLRGRTVVVAHNLAYDLRIADAFTVLPELGYRLDMIRMDGGAAWCQWRRDGRSLAMTDSVSWFGCSVDRLAQLEGMVKPRLPRADASDAEWLARCRADVAILRAAWLRTVNWCEDADLGNWKPTGAGQGWAAFRHKHLTHPILHHSWPRLAAMEREAAWTGRCEAWRHGRLPRGPWTEYDLESAYTHVAEDCDVPTRLIGHVGPRTAERALEGPVSESILARVVVSTDVPTVPARSTWGVWWPVGRFETILWENELRLARENGATVEVLDAWRYRRAPALRQWASWILDLLDLPASELHPTLRAVVKGWSRTTVGRFASRWSEWEHFGDSMGGRILLADSQDPDTGERTRLMSLGDRTLIEGDKRDAPDSAVFVMSWVMAECRVRLWRVLVAAGRENVAYCDTDAVIVNPEGARRLEAAQVPGLRVKGQWGSVEILGPRQLVLNGKLRAAGVPARAVRNGAYGWRGEVWRSLPASIGAGEIDRVVVRDREWRITGVDHRRAHLDGGLTAPIAVG